MSPSLAPAPALVPPLRQAATLLLRYGLVVIVLWFGLFKFTAAEAQAIQPLVAHSPLLGWLYAIFDLQGTSRLIGAAEILIAVLIALRPVAAGLSAAGSLAAVGMFLTTLSFLGTTPGVWVRVEWLVVPTEAGAFLLKDIFLLGAALWTASDALDAALTRRPVGGAADTSRRSTARSCPVSPRA